MEASEPEGSLRSQIDFPVEATVRLDVFSDQREVLKILRSHGFKVDPRRDEVRVKGSFLGLKSAKADLELLETHRPPSLASPSYGSASSGTVPKTRHNGASGGSRSRSGSRNKPSHDTTSSPNASEPLMSVASHLDPNSPPYRAARPLEPGQNQVGSVRRGQQTLAVEGDVFRYAERVRRKSMDDILHDVKIKCNEAGDSVHITIEGRNAGLAAAELQKFLGGLHKSLRTQEVLFQDMSQKGMDVLREIKKGKDVYHSVLVCNRGERLHLIGPSAESYDLKKLLERATDGPGPTKRTRNSWLKGLSQSLPTKSRNKGTRESGCVAGPSPGRTKEDVALTCEDQRWNAEPEPSNRRTRSVSKEHKQVTGKNEHTKKATSFTARFKGLFKK